MVGRFNWDWSGDGPPEEAYSRVTEPERFEPLHGWALEAVAQLQTKYAVARAEGTGMDPKLERSPLARPTIKLTPPQASCAPITIAFTDFPGLAVRFGRWVTEWYPSCGCDACDEMPEGAFEEFTKLLDCVVSMGFRESLDLPRRGDGWITREFRSDEYRGSGKTRVSRDGALAILNGADEIVLEWMPWQPKPEIYLETPQS